MTNKDVDQFIFKIRQAKLISSIDEALDLGNEELFIALTSELNRLKDEHYKLLTQH